MKFEDVKRLVRIRVMEMVDYPILIENEDEEFAGATPVYLTPDEWEVPTIYAENAWKDHYENRKKDDDHSFWKKRDPEEDEDEDENMNKPAKLKWVSKKVCYMHCPYFYFIKFVFETEAEAKARQKEQDEAVFRKLSLAESDQLIMKNYLGRHKKLGDYYSFKASEANEISALFDTLTHLKNSKEDV